MSLIEKIERRLRRTAHSTRLRLARALLDNKDFDGEFFRVNNPLVCVVTGMENSGTTLLSQLLNGHPRIASGVECGLLLSNLHDFNKVQPFYDWMIEGNWSWGVTPADRSRIMTCRTFEEAYWVLNQCKGRGNPNPDIRKVFMESDLIYDKTPRYVYSLDKIMAKVSRPFIVTLKTPIEQYSSAKKRGQTNLRSFMRQYALAAEKISASQKAFDGRLLVVKYDDLATQPERVMKRGAAFVGLDGGERLTMDQYNRRFGRFIESGNSFSKTRKGYSPSHSSVTVDEERELDSFGRDLPEIKTEAFESAPEAASGGAARGA